MRARRNKFATTAWLPADHIEALRAVSAAVGVPVAKLIREGIDAVLRRARKHIDFDNANETTGRH